MTLLKKKFILRGVDCDECEKIVVTQSLSVEGIEDILLDRKNNTAEIHYEDGADWKLVWEKLEKKGYPCEEMKEELFLEENHAEQQEERHEEIMEREEEHKEEIIREVHTKIKVKNMVCTSCEKIISKAVHALPGIHGVVVDYDSASAEIVYDSEKVSLDEIKEKIKKKGYEIVEGNEREGGNNSWVSWVFAGAGILLVGYFALQLYSNFSVPQLSQNMGYGLLFLVGLLTGFHCVAMCGGFVVSYTARGVQQGKKPHQLHFSYALGKTISYTVIGALFGLLGSVIAFTPKMRGIAGILAGTFLILFGIKMLGLPWLRKFQIQWPRSINKWIGHESKIHAQSPLVIGLLNGLMIACGPLQAVYIMAAGTGSMIEGAKLLFVFGLGTLPVMLGFGYFTSIISAKATMKILKFSGLLVIILGLIMVNRGVALTGTSWSAGFWEQKGITSSVNQGNEQIEGITLKDGYQEIRMTVDSGGYTPNKFVLKKGVPVRWIIDGKKLNGCNSAIQVPKYNLNFQVKSGLQTIEFTPTEEGTVPWSCSMGMLRGTFIVQEQVDQATVQQTLNQVNVPKGSTCGAGGGGCGCGGAQ
ncbi:sulfite exporter TauE/SafE family protein [Candidatus Woesearchaeota archaeon]|nr:sulfite exporter TauE/SafE family protein [Candidatus Woesearchaeota archaeon]